MVDSCEIKLWEHPNYTGERWKSFNSSKPEGDSWINDRDSSAKIYGNCKNTSYLVFEHPNYTGYAYILGEGDNIPNLHDGNSHGKGKGSGGRDHRWHKRGDRMNAVQRIDIPAQNINEGRMRQDITIYGKRVDWKPHEWGHFPAITKASDAGDSDQWITDQNNKGKACPGGDAYWKGFQKVSCVYDVKTGDKLGRLRTLHREQKNSTISNDPRKDMYDKLVTDYCDRADRLEDRVTSESGNASKCRSIVDAKKMAKDYCEKGDKIKTDATLCTKETDSLGPTLYDELASKYCDANPTDPFCGCYNVVTNKCKGEDIDKEIKKLEDGRKPIEGVRYVWYGFDDKEEYLNIAQIEVYSGGVNIVKDIDGSKVTVGSRYDNNTGYAPDNLFDGNYESIYHSGLDVNVTTVPKGEPVNWETITGKKFSARTMSREKRYINASTGAEKSFSSDAYIENTSVDGCKTQCEKFDTCKSIIMADNNRDSCFLTSTTTTETVPYATLRGGSIIQKKGGYNFVKIDLGKEYTIDQVKIFNRKSCGSKESNNICNDRWAGSYVKLLRSNGSLIKASEKVVGDHKQGGERVITFFDNGVGAAKAKLNIPGCKITVPIRRTLTDLPRKYSAALDGKDKCWGNVCTSKGGETFVPENAIIAGGICSKSMTICNVDLRADNLQDSEINIEQKCGEYEGEPSPMSEPSSNEPSEPSDGSTDGTPAPMDSSGKTSSVPVTPSSTPTSSSTPASTEELKIYEKPSVQIGTVASSLVSISSCAILIMLAM